MGEDDVTTEQSPTHEHGRELSGPPARGLGRQGEPLFKRFAVSKDWRVKDGATG